MLSFSSKSINLLNDEGFPGTEDIDEFGPTECSLQEGGAFFGVPIDQRSPHCPVILPP
jgi:hypothetical protein